MHEVIITPLSAQRVTLELPGSVIPVGVLGGSAPRAVASAVARVALVTGVRHSVVAAVRATGQALSYVSVPTGLIGGSGSVAAVPAGASGVARAPVATTIRNETVTPPIATATGVTYVPGLGGALSNTSFATISLATTNARIAAAAGGATVNAVLATAASDAVTPVVTGPTAATGVAVKAAASASAVASVIVGGATVNAVRATATTDAVDPTTPVVISVIAKKSSAASDTEIPIVDAESVVTGGGPGAGSAVAYGPFVTGQLGLSPTMAALGDAYDSGGAVTSFPIPMPQTVGAASVVDIVVMYLDSGTAAITPPAGFTETDASPATVTGTQPHALRVYWKYAAGSDTGNYTFTSSPGSDCEARVMRFTGCIVAASPIGAVTLAPVSGIKTTTTDGLTPSLSLTTTNPNRTWVWVGTCHTSSACTTLSSFIEMFDDGNIVADVKQQASPGSTGGLVGTFTSAGSTAAWLGALLS